MPFILLFLFATSAFAAISGESNYPSLSQDGGMKGNPAGLSAYGSSGVGFGYEKDNFVFGLWGDTHGAAFDWTTGDYGYDRSQWSYLFNMYNASRYFFFGNRFSLTKVSLKENPGFSWSPGLIWRPVALLSFGFWSEHIGQYGFSQDKIQNFGFSIRPFREITASWNLKASSQIEQNILIELDVSYLTLGLELPLVEPNKDGEIRISLSSAFGQHFNASATVNATDFNNMKYKRFNLLMHSGLNQEALEYVNMLRIPLGSISEKSSGWSLLGGGGNDLETLRNTFSMLEKSDARVIVFDFSDYSGSLSISQEIRRGINSLKSAGKKIAAYTNDYRPSVILAASAANKVILQPSAFVDFKGLASEVLYYKGFFDLVGIKVEMVRHGNYKSATEPYSLDSMSNEARENLQGILNGMWSAIRDTVAASRKLSPEFLDSIANNPRLTASSAKNNGLADTLLYLESLPEYLSKEMLGKENKNAYFETWYLSDEKLYSNSWQPRAKIAVLNIDGMLVGGYGSSDPLFGKSVTGVADLIDVVNEIGYSGEYEALILRINSPGGSAIASDELWHALKTLRKSGMPIIASVGDMAASGAYYAAAAADKIVAEAPSIVGSIGIYGGKADLSGLLSKLRIKSEVVKTHESANAKSIFGGISEKDSIALQEYMDDFYSRFVGAVAEGRNMSEERIDSLGGGMVFTGMDAIGLGLVDEIGGFERALELAREGAGLKKSARVEVVHINNYGYSFADKIYSMAKGQSFIYPWLNALEKTQVWAVYF